MAVRASVIAFAFLGAVGAGCDHTAPFSPGTYTTLGPFGAGNPVRLTYNPGVDERPAWLPDGTAFFYTQELDTLASSDRDRCLAQMPAGGGAVTRELCAADDPHHDSLNVFVSPAIAGDRRMAYLETSMVAHLGRVGADHSALVLATYTSPLASRVVQIVPFFDSSSSRSVDVVSDVAWLSTDTLVFLGEELTYPAACGSCTPDTVRAGLEIDLLDLSRNPPVLSLVPNTDQASSVAVVGGDTLYHTLTGSSTVLRRVGVAGTDTVIFDFGAAGPATDVTVAGGRIAAVVNGVLHVVTLATGTDSIVSDLQTTVRHPAFDPRGKRLLAEVVPPGGAGPKPLPPDLWLWTLP